MSIDERFLSFPDAYVKPTKRSTFGLNVDFAKVQFAYRFALSRLCCCFVLKSSHFGMDKSLIYGSPSMIIISFHSN